MEVSVRPPKAPLCRHYDVISCHYVSKLAIRTPIFNALGCLDQILWTEMEKIPQCYDEIKMPSAYRVKH